MNTTVAIDLKRCRRPNCRKPLGPKDPRDGAQAYLCSDCRSSSLWTGLTPRPPAPRAFTAADRSFIRKVNGFMPAQQLLDVLNERLQADVGHTAQLYARARRRRLGGAAQAAGPSARGRHARADLGADDRRLRRRLLADAGAGPAPQGRDPHRRRAAMTRAVFRREELLTAGLSLGSIDIDLADYATTGLRVVTVGPSGIGKTNAGLLIAEQLAKQGWVSVLVDPEGEIEELYGKAVAGVDELRQALAARAKDRKS